MYLNLTQYALFLLKIKSRVVCTLLFQVRQDTGGVQMDVRHLFPPKKRYHYVQEV